MTGHESDNYDAAQLDALLDSAMSGMLAKLEAGFDANGELADIYARAGAYRGDLSDDTAMAAEKVPSAGSSRLAEVCHQIDVLSGRLAEITRSGQEAPFGGSSYLELARDSLMQLRTGLASRSASKNEAERLTGQVQRHLEQADQILRSQHAASLDELAAERTHRAAGSQDTLADEIRVVREMVIRLFAGAGQGSSLVPAR
jgi:hypothetical protein